MPFCVFGIMIDALVIIVGQILILFYLVVERAGGLSF